MDYTYDVNGNRATKAAGGTTHTYTYDRENRLVKVNDGTSDIFTAVYDYRTRRMEKSENGTTVKFVYDGGVNIQELDASSSLTKYLVRGTGMGGGIGSVLYAETSTTKEYFCYNAIGSTVALTDSTSAVTSTSDYEAFGKIVRTTGSTNENRQFCTKERDGSIGLVNFGFRFYDEDLGRFITRDPIGYPDGPNNYHYCSSNPINHIDPLGLQDNADEKEKEIGEDAESTGQGEKPEEETSEGEQEEPFQFPKGVTKEDLPPGVTVEQYEKLVNKIKKEIKEGKRGPRELLDPKLKDTTIHDIGHLIQKYIKKGSQYYLGERRFFIRIKTPGGGSKYVRVEPVLVPGTEIMATGPKHKATRIPGTATEATKEDYQYIFVEGLIYGVIKDQGKPEDIPEKTIKQWGKAGAQTYFKETSVGQAGGGRAGNKSLKDMGKEAKDQYIEELKE